MSDAINKAMKYCGEFNLHIKTHCKKSRDSIHCPPLETHYIMRGNKIIASLPESCVTGWIIRKSQEALRVKSLLKSEGLRLSDYEICKSSLMQTVSPKANLKIYEDFLF